MDSISADVKRQPWIIGNEERKFLLETDGSELCCGIETIIAAEMPVNHPRAQWQVSDSLPRSRGSVGIGQEKSAGPAIRHLTFGLSYGRRQSSTGIKCLKGVAH